MAETLPSVAELLPHQPPMRLLDAVTGWTEARVEARVTVGPGVTFFQPDLGIPGWVGVEYLGQAAAAWFSLAARRTGGDESGGTRPQPGMLVACRRYRTPTGYFPPDAVLAIAVWPTSPLPAAMVKFAGDIRWDSRTAGGELSVYMTPPAPGGTEGVA